ncbi:hypothetical protein ACFV2H_44740 [Streptomyces sp. NPDC059629]|uniref:hypothetical protein n=1 Tax=Streptomyces sp. NPDC059629 TaxID=3346889 RepID=UPI0036B9B2FC
MRHRRRALLLLLTAALLTSCSGSGGTALDGAGQGSDLVGYEHTQVGKEYWVTMPEMSNHSGKPLTVLSAEIAHVPAGLRVTGYRVVSAGAGGHVIGVIPVGVTDDNARPHKGSSIQIKAHDSSDLYYEARVKVTGAVHSDLTNCTRQALCIVTEVQEDGQGHLPETLQYIRGRRSTCPASFPSAFPSNSSVAPPEFLGEATEALHQHGTSNRRFTCT